MATATANGNKKRKLAHKPALSATTIAATAHAVASAKAQGLLVSDLGFIYTSEEKMQHVEQVTTTAKEVMIRQLTTDLSYDVTDAEYERLVQLTQAHPSFKQQFTFPYDEAAGWVRPSTTKKKSHLRVVAIDCEMCVTMNLKTKKSTTGALIRVSAVDGDNMLENLLADLIVHQPEEGTRILDPVTDIHGISMAMIEASKISVTKAQKQMLKFINADTIVVGHSVSGDLASLRIDHQRVIDTAMLFSRIGVPANARGSTPGLKCLTKFLLKFEMPNGHDSTIDAQASMLAAKYAARNPIGAIIPSARELHGPKPKEEPRRSVHLAPPPRGNYPLPVRVNHPLPPPVLVNHPLPPVPSTDRGDRQANAASRVAAKNAQAAAESAKAAAESAMAALADAQELAKEQAKALAAIQTVRNSDKAAFIASKTCRLRLHRIPKGVTNHDIAQFFANCTSVKPVAIEAIQWLPNQKNRGSCSVTFASSDHASLAFSSVTLPPKAGDAAAAKQIKATRDSIGRLQKQIAVTTSKGTVFNKIMLGVL